MSKRNSSLKHTALVTATGAFSMAAALFMTGCGLGSTANPAATNLVTLAGVLHGGQSPIQGAAITLYVTTATATTYGAPATVIGTGVTDVNGNFQISNSQVSSANCPAGQQAYVTAAGGYPSGAPSLANNSMLMMAAIGDCANVTTSTQVVINEVTTVAAGYALSGFMTTSVNGSLYMANVSAPAANRVSTPDATDASGLAHAFLNAASLVSPFTGTAAYATAAQTIGGKSVSGSVPLAEINTLGDILQSCVNTATGSTACKSLFSFTPSITNVAPANTLQSIINLARNPYPSAAAMTAASGLFSLASSTPAFVPALSAQPADWAMAIRWPNTTAPYFLTLDANDTVYYGASASTTIVGLSAYGNSTPAYTAATGVGTATRQIAADALGNVWVVSSSTGLLQYNAGTGALTNTTTVSGGALYGVAVDKTNNVWVANGIAGSASVPNLTEYAYTASTGSKLASYTVNYTAYVPSSFQPDSVAIDQNQNIWVAPYFTNASIAAVLPNTTVGATTAAAPAYGTVGTPSAMVSATFSNGAIKPIGLTFDATGNAWYGITGTPSPTTTGLEEVIPNTYTGVITSLAPQTLVANATLGAGATGIPMMDGAGTMFLADNSGAGGQGFHAYSTQAGTASSLTSSQIISPPAGYLGCYLATPATTTCGTGSGSAVYNPRTAVIDSTGSVWGGVTSGGVTQIIGLAAPSYPLLSIGRPGVEPGTTGVATLP